MSRKIYIAFLWSTIILFIILVESYSHSNYHPCKIYVYTFLCSSGTKKFSMQSYATLTLETHLYISSNSVGSSVLQSTAVYRFPLLRMKKTTLRTEKLECSEARETLQSCLQGWYENKCLVVGKDDALQFTTLELQGIIITWPCSLRLDQWINSSLIENCRKQLVKHYIFIFSR